MNFLSPDDIFSGMRRKSLCNGALLSLSTQNGKNGSSNTGLAGTDSTNSTPSKSKKERRRGSFNEATANNSSSGGGGRRSSLVSRWFKHISDAAEQYKPRSKNANHEPVDDPAIATLPHSNTKESLELTPERPPPISATATVTTTPLAPMMAAPTVHSPHVNNNNSYDGGVQLRNGRRESTPTSSTSQLSGAVDSGPAYQNLQHRQVMSHHDQLSPAVNRTMSTRSCGEANNNYGNTDQTATVNGVTLRHTQSARQASNDTSGSGGTSAGGLDTVGATAGSGASKRDSASIVYSNNSNNTRTLMQSSPPLVQPTAIQISISPAHTAEPVLTPAERLRRLDASIRDGLLEKQKIICDMFRLPVEHFHEIVDIAAMPEAPKDSADIALAAYAQVQSLTEVLNDYMHVTSEQEISAVSTAVCDQCHEKQQQRQQQNQHQQPQRPVTPLAPLSTSTSSSSGVSAATQISTVEQQTPPPLPPPNKPQKQPQTAQQQTPAPTAAKLQTPIAALDDACIHEDDDGYCEIDELRLPALPPHIAVPQQQNKAASPPPPPLPPPAKSQSATAAAQTAQQSQASNQRAPPTNATSPPELIKRQSTISTDSIPEESADELTLAALEDSQTAVGDETNDAAAVAKDISSSQIVDIQPEVATENIEEAAKTQSTESSVEGEESQKEAEKSAATTELNATQETTEATEQPKTEAVTEADNSKAAETAAATAEKQEAEQEEEQTKLNEALTNLSKLSAVISTMDSTTQTLPLSGIPNLNLIGTNNSNLNGGGQTLAFCGPNRIQHANSLEPSVPCHALNSIVGALNAQISLLLPKINERDMERERLRKENQHLRELLNAMHERQRVEDKLETPMHSNNAAAAVDANDEIDGNTNKTNKATTNGKNEVPNSPTATTAPNSPPATTAASTEKIEN